MSWARHNFNKTRQLNNVNRINNTGSISPINIANNNKNINSIIKDIVNDKYFIKDISDKISLKLNNTKSIPKIAFTFWEGSEFTFLHYLTIKSFIQYNPDYKIIIYSTEDTSEINKTWTTDEHEYKIKNNLYDINKLKEFSNVEFVICDIKKYFPELNVNLSCIHKSDIIRILKLYEHGGIWIDFDILFFKQIPEIYLNLKENNIGIFKYNNQTSIPIGLIFSHKNNIILESMIDIIKNIIKHTDYMKHYEIFGTHIWSSILNLQTITPYVSYYPVKLCYAYMYDKLNDLYYTNNNLLDKDSVCIHWYNGSPITKKYINDTNFNNIQPNSIFNSIIYKLLQ
jgi:mannosyltransferase OCH1-like enzyme